MSEQNSWFSTEGEGPYTRFVGTPFDYKYTIIPFVKDCAKNELVKFSTTDDTVEFVKPAREVYRVITHVVDLLKKGGTVEILTPKEGGKLLNAKPWEFWTNREIQNIITKLVVEGKKNEH